MQRGRLVAAVGLWLFAAILVALGPVVGSVAAICDENCPVPARHVLAWGALPILLSAIPSAAAASIRIRRPVAAAAIAALLVAYAGAAGAVAVWLGRNGTIHGDAAWVAFWLVAFAGWAGIAFALSSSATRRYSSGSHTRP